MLVCVLMKGRWLLELRALVACGVVVVAVVADAWFPMKVVGGVESQTKLMRRRHAENGVGG